MRRQSLTILIALLCTPALALAQQQQQPAARGDAPPIHNLTITPAAPPRPALKYPLLPPVMEQTPGNAALLYQRAMLQLATISRSGTGRDDGSANDGDDFDRISSLIAQTPLAQLPQSEAPALLAKYRSVLSQLDEAARCESVRWELPLRSQGISTLLPHLSPMRDLARLVALRTRVQVANRQYGEAIRSLQTGFAMARHLDDQAVLIQGLVALGIGSQMLDRAQELIQQPGAPNLYWALADLPRPIVNVRTMLQSERNFLYYTYPHLRNPQTMTREQWEETIANIGRIWSDQNQLSALGSQTLSTLWAVRLYPEAKRYLIDGGMAPEAVEAIPSFRVVAMYCTGSYDQWLGETTKWWSLPPWQGYEGLCRSDAEVSSVKNAGVGGPFVQVLLPGLRRAYLQFATWDRSIAALQTVEAIRAYAAAHEGKLPAALADTAQQQTPPPIDPFTGKVFEYQLQDGRATLTAPAPTREDARFSARYQLTIR